MRNQSVFKILVIVLFNFVCLSFAHAGQVIEKQGNIFYDAGDGKSQQLTDSGKDSQPVLSPDGKLVAFVRTVDNQGTELWLMDNSGSNARAIVQSHEESDIKKSISEINNPLFALNSKAVYFQTATWATSNAIHLYDLNTDKYHFITDGNSLELVPKGKYKNYLIVSKHKYYKKRDGSYEDFCLVSPKGKEIKSLGEEQEQVNTFIKAN